MTALWLFAFVWTLAIEVPIYAVAIGRRFARWWSVVAAALVVNAITHPLLWFVYPRVEPRWLHVASGELAVFATEAILLGAVVRHRDAIVAALVANAASYALGNVLFAIVL